MCQAQFTAGMEVHPGKSKVGVEIAGSSRSSSVGRVIINRARLAGLIRHLAHRREMVGGVEVFARGQLGRGDGVNAERIEPFEDVCAGSVSLLPKSCSAPE